MEPSSNTISHIFGVGKGDPGLTLQELFVEGRADDDKTLDHLLKVARLKVIGVFRLTEVMGYGRTRRPARTDHYLPDMDGSADQLVTFIARHMKGSHDFVRPSDLPPRYRVLTKHWRDTVRAQARYLLLRETVNQLLFRQVAGQLEENRTQLWYHSGQQRWQASQSLIDEYEPLLRQTKGISGPKRHPKWDDRSWHGRPRRDRERNVVPGTSVGAMGH